MTRNPIGEALCSLVLAAATVRDTIRDLPARIDRWLARAATNPDDPDASDAAAASPVADYRSNA